MWCHSTVTHETGSSVPQPAVGMGKLKVGGDILQDMADMAHCIILCFLTEDSADDTE